MKFKQFLLRFCLQAAIIIASVILLYACQSVNPFEPKKNVKHTSIDSLMVELTTIMGQRPKGVLNQDRHEPRYRKYYTDLSKEFSLIYYHVTPDGCHYYYALRPARNNTGKVNRGVGGRFRLNTDGEVILFEEVFNTKIFPKGELEEMGLELFKEMIETGGIGKFINNKKLVEWPDDRTIYDMGLNEWIYIKD